MCIFVHVLHENGDPESLSNLLNELHCGTFFMKLDLPGLQNSVFSNIAPSDISPGPMIDDF